MGQVVSIEVRVDNEQAQAALAGIQESMAATGTTGSASLKQIVPAAAEVDKAMLTNRESVRLASEEMGLKIPRAMQSVISNCAPAMAAISALSTAMVGIGFISIGVMLFKELDQLYGKWFDVNAAASEYAKNLDDLKNKEFTNTRSIDDTILRINEATAAVEAYKRAAAAEDQKANERELAWGDVPFVGDIGVMWARHSQKVLAEKQFAAQKQLDQLKGEAEPAQRHDLTLKAIDSTHSSDGLTGDAKAQADYERKMATIQENANFRRAQDARYGNPVADGKDQTQLAEEKQAKADLDAAKAEDRKSKASNNDKQRIAEITRLQREADEAGLSGIALLEAHRADALADFKAKYGANAQAIADINRRFDENEDSERKRQADERQRDVDSYVAAAQKGASESALAATHGYEHISLQAQQAADEANAEYERQTQVVGLTLDQQSALYAAHQQQLTDIQAKAQAERDQLAQRGDAIVAATAAGADSHIGRGRGGRGMGFAAMAQQHAEAMQRIQEQEKAKDDKLEQQYNAGELRWDQLQQAEVNTHREAMEEMAQQNEQQRDQLAGTLQSAFTDPQKFIEQESQKMMFRIIADWVMQLHMFKSLAGHTMSGVGPGAPTGGGLFSNLHAARDGGGGGVSASTASYWGADHTGAGSPVGASAVGAPRVAMSVAPSGAGVGSVGVGGGSSAGFTSSGYGGSAFTGAGSVGAPAPSTSSTGSIAGYGSMAQSGYADFKSLMPGIQALRAPGAPNMPGATDAITMNADGTTSIGSHEAGADAINSQADVDTATSGLGGAASHTGSTALGVAGAATASYGAGNEIWGGLQQGGAKSYMGNALAGAGAGASIGMLFGPVGALIGAGIGAAVGLGASAIGSIFHVAGHSKARKYFHDQLDPEIQHDVADFRTGGGDFQTAISGINKTASEGMIYAQKNFGNEAASYMMNTYLAKDVTTAVGEISRLAKAGMAGLKTSAAQFHDGGSITGFGSFATSSTEGFIHAMLGETVMNRNASTNPLHAPALAGINSGADAATLAAHYLSKMTGGGGAGTPAGGDTHHHWDVTTLDAKSFRDMLRDGGAEAISGELNYYTGQYSGAGRN